MMALLAAVGWGLLATGAITHVWHHGRLRELLAQHLDHERIPALALTAVEVIVAIALPITWLGRSPALPVIAGIAFAVAAGFVVWIGRLLITGSELPCACSFSDAPTSWWSLARSVCVALVVLFVVAERDTSAATSVTTLAVGWALAAAIFVVPEAVTWPSASKALLARVDAHTAEVT